ncbi:MAG: hypothetical protein JJU33_12515 [Phycisphaerales bacterium]|nr:hypothetical protein [Phycisphaerales bacterium]
MNTDDRRGVSTDPRPWKAEDVLRVAVERPDRDGSPLSTRERIERCFDATVGASSEAPTADRLGGIGLEISSIEPWSGSPAKWPTSDAELPSQPPAQIPNHELVSCLGAGGFGQVWLARQLLTGHFRACKLVPEEKSVELEGLRHLKQRVPSHHGLLPIEDVGAVEGWLYCLMPLADSATSTVVRDASSYDPMTLAVYAGRGRPPSTETASIVASLADATAHLHAHGVTHGDIKPANILRLDGRWVLADYGLARDLAKPSGQGRTPGYLPESEDPGSPAADRFALGVVLMGLLTVQTPDRLEEVRSTAPERFGLDPIGQRLFEVMHRATSPRPEDRFGSAGELASAVRRAAEEAEVRPAPWKRWLPAGVLLAAGLLIAVFAGLVLLQSAGPKEGPASTAAVDAETAPATDAEALSPASVRIESFEIRHYRYDPTTDTLVSVGPLGADNPAARDDDDVTVHARLDGPAYFYLVSLDTDGVVRPRLPDSPTEAPAPVDRIDYPSFPTGSEEDLVFNLSRGPGTQGFMLLVSAEPLPSWSDWVAARGEPTWTTESLPPSGVVFFDGSEVRYASATREPMPRRGRLVQDPIDWAMTHGEFSAVRFIAFTVLEGGDG